MRYCLAQNCKMQKMLHISYTKILASSGLKALLHLMYSNAALKSVGFPMHAEVWNSNAKHFYSNASFSLKTGSYVANTKTIKICFVIFQEDFTHQCFLTLVPRLLCCFYII